MALRFIDDPSYYQTSDIVKVWRGGNGLMVTTATFPAFAGMQAGEQVIAHDPNVGSNASGAITDNFGNQARLIGKTRFYRPTNAAGIVCGFTTPLGLGSASFVAVFAVDNSGSYIYDGAGTTGTHILATGPVVVANVWTDVEFDVVFGIANTAVLKVYLNGNPTPFLQALTATTNGTTATSFCIGSPINATSMNFGYGSINGYWTHSYVLDGTSQVGTGGANYNHALSSQGLGSLKVAYAVPAGPGRITVGWTPNGAATVWQSINQIPQDGDTTYASDATPGDAFMCTIGSLPTMQTVVAAQIVTFAREDDAGPRAIQTGFGDGATEGYSGVDQFLPMTYSTTFDEYAINPNTGLAWTPANLVGLQIGAKVTI